MVGTANNDATDVCVIAIDVVEGESPPAPTFATPTSSSVGPSAVSSTTDGFSPPCITPRRCALSSESAIAIAICSAWFSSSGPRASDCVSVSPSTNSLTTKSVAGS
jgi:hypothetical protein